jgi:hypothetical protein
MTEFSLVLIPTLSTVPGPGARGEALALAMPVVPVSFQGSGGTARLVLGTSPFVSPDGDSLPPTHPQNDSLPLSAFLNLNVAQTLPENHAEGEILLAEPSVENPAARSQTMGRSEQGFESREERADSASPSAGPSFPTADEGHFEAAGAGNTEKGGLEAHKSGSWIEFLQSLLIAVGIPVIWSFYRAPHADKRSDSVGKQRRSAATR